MTDKNSISHSRSAGSVPLTVSVRLTAEERAQLVKAAGQQSLSRFIRARLFDGIATELDDGSRLSPQSRQKLLAQILMRLGKLDLVHNVNTLLSGVQSGLIETSPELCAALEAAHEELTALRHDLLKALGLRP